MVQNLSSDLASSKRVEQAKLLWEKVLESKYLADDVYDRSTSKIEGHRAEIQAFLRAEQVEYRDRPNAARSLALLLTLLSPATTKMANDALSTAFLKLGLARLAESSSDRTTLSSSDVQGVVLEILSEIGAVVENDVENYVARTGTYSSVYAALLALLLDELAIRRQLELLENLLSNVEVIRCLSKKVFKPGALFWSTYYRGQRHDWIPLPKTFQRGAPSKMWLQRLRSWRSQTVARAKFAAALPGLKLGWSGTPEIEAVLQHYGFPTSLLDVTTNMEVAAFFATWNCVPNDVGVIYRYHLAHPYALTVLASYLGGKSDIGMTHEAEKMRDIALRALKELKIVSADKVERIRRQDGHFIRGVASWATLTFFQPVYFRQQSGLLYGNSAEKITEADLLPPNDPIEKIAVLIRERMR